MCSKYDYPVKHSNPHFPTSNSPTTLYNTSMPKIKNKPKPNSTTTPTKLRHYFFLNPYQDCAFTKCPKCNTPTKVRKFPLVIHVEPEQLFVLNKNCKYCLKCDLIIVKQSDIEALMTAQFEIVDPSLVGNDYLVIGTLDKKDWRENMTTAFSSQETIDKAYIFASSAEFVGEFECQTRVSHCWIVVYRSMKPHCN